MLSNLCFMLVTPFVTTPRTWKTTVAILLYLLLKILLIGLVCVKSFLAMKYFVFLLFWAACKTQKTDVKSEKLDIIYSSSSCCATLYLSLTFSLVRILSLSYYMECAFFLFFVFFSFLCDQIQSKDKTTHETKRGQREWGSSVYRFSLSYCSLPNRHTGTTRYDEIVDCWTIN